MDNLSYAYKDEYVEFLLTILWNSMFVEQLSADIDACNTIIDNMIKSINNILRKTESDDSVKFSIVDVDHGAMDRVLSINKKITNRTINNDKYEVKTSMEGIIDKIRTLDTQSSFIGAALRYKVLNKSNIEEELAQINYGRAPAWFKGSYRKVISELGKKSPDPIKNVPTRKLKKIKCKKWYKLTKVDTDKSK